MYYYVDICIRYMHICQVESSEITLSVDQFVTAMLLLWQLETLNPMASTCLQHVDIVLHLVISCHILLHFVFIFPWFSAKNSINVSFSPWFDGVPNGSQDLIWGRSLRHWKPPPNRRQRRQRRQHGERGNSVRSNLKFVHVRLPIWEQVVSFWVCWLLLVSTQVPRCINEQDFGLSLMFFFLERLGLLVGSAYGCVAFSSRQGRMRCLAEDEKSILEPVLYFRFLYLNRPQSTSRLPRI